MDICVALKSIPSELIGIIHNYSHIERGQLFFEIDIDFQTTTSYAFFNDTFVVCRQTPVSQLFVFCGKSRRSLIRVENVDRIFIEHQKIIVFHSVGKSFTIFDLDGRLVSKIPLNISIGAFYHLWGDSPATSGFEFIVPICICNQQHSTTFQTYDIVSSARLFSFNVNEVVYNSCIDSKLNVFVSLHSTLKKFDKHGNTIQVFRPHNSIYRPIVIQDKLYFPRMDSGNTIICDEFGYIKWQFKRSTSIYDCETLTSDGHLLLATRYDTGKMKFRCFY